MTEDWFKVYRKLTRSDFWLSEKFTRPQAWIDLISLANHEPKWIRKRGIKVEVKRGQVGWSEETLAERWKWSRGKVRRFLSELGSEMEQKIEQQKSNVTTLITILNYERYQGSNTANSTTNGHQTVQQTVQEQESKERKEILEGIRIPSSSTDGGQPDPPEPPKIDRTPHKEIIAAYHEILSELPRIQESLWPGSTAERELRARWRENPKRQDVEFWKKLFRYIRGCPWLMGQVSSGNGKPPFQADLRWIVNRTNFTKICEGRYERR